VIPFRKTTPARKLVKAAVSDRDLVWLTAISLVGLVASCTLGLAFPLLDPWEDAHGAAATVTSTVAEPIEAKVQPSWHEQFDRQPVQIDANKALAPLSR